MRRFFLYVNWSKKAASETVVRLRDLLLAGGAESVIMDQALKREEIAGIADCIITLGGDGTIIRAARAAAGSGVPIAGINLGHLGYLTSISREEDIPSFAAALLRDDFEVENRMMLEGSISAPGEREEERNAEWAVALNEIAVCRKDAGGPVAFRIFANGAFLNEYKADGIIISTPTGSTAYNLSAGGPIVDPVAQVQILTPICPHALNRSSIVLRAEDRIDLLIPRTSRTETVSFDGTDNSDLMPGSSIRIRKSSLVTPLIRLRGGNFLTQLRNKMAAI